MKSIKWGWVVIRSLFFSVLAVLLGLATAASVGMGMPLADAIRLLFWVVGVILGTLITAAALIRVVMNW